MSGPGQLLNRRSSGLGGGVSAAWGGGGAPEVNDGSEGVVIDEWSESQLAAAVAAFRKHDTDGDGTLQYAEFASAVRDLIGSDEGGPIDHLHLRAAFHRLDADHSKTIDFHEYLNLISHQRGASRGEAMRSLLFDLDADGLTADDVERAAAAFRRHDADRRGALSPRSFGAVVGKLALAEGHKYTDEELAGLMRRADLDADGEVDFHELLRLLARQKRVLAAKQLVEKGKAQRLEEQQRDEEAARQRVARLEERARELERQNEQKAASQHDEAERRAAQAEREAEERDAALMAKQQALAQDGKNLAYMNMLRDELKADGCMSQLPHVPGFVADVAVAFFAAFEHHRDGRLRVEDFTRGLVRYGKVVNNASGYKRELLTRAFGMADSTNTGSLSIGDFMRYIGQGGILHVNPAALATCAGCTLRPDGSVVAREEDEPAPVNGSGGKQIHAAVHTAFADDPLAQMEAPRAMDEYASELRQELESSGVLRQLPHVTDEHVDGFIEFYRAFDGDADGHLTPREFVTGLKAYGRAIGNPNAYQRRHLVEAFDAADVSSDAQLELSEFVKFVAKGGRINMDVRAMRRAATEWLQLQAFEHTQMNATQSGIFGGQDAASYPAESDSEDDGADPPLVEDGRGGLRRAGASKQSRTVKAAAADAACSAAQGAFGIFQAWGGGSICDVPEKKNRTKPINGQATSAVGGAANRAMGAMGPMGAMGAMCGAAGGGAGKRSCRCPYEAKCFYKGASTGNLPAATRADAIASGLANMRGKVGGKRFDKALEAFSVW